MNLTSRLLVTVLPLVPRPIVGAVARRYVAGPTLDDAVRVVADLNRQGALGTMDLLGEWVDDGDKAVEAVAEYIRLFDAIAAHRLEANVSIKLTLLGLKLDEDFCRANVERIAEAARSHGNFVRIDMEDSSTHDAALRIYHALQPRLANLGVVFQSYMRRLSADIEALPERGANVRLCKGIYVEPREIAWQEYDTVRVNFLAALDKLLVRGAYVGIATHDEYLICASCALLDRHRVPRERYEFQMLLGVEEELRRILLAEGHRLRVYVPYGRDWYPYSLRRLRENPEVARHVARAFLRRRR